MNLAMDLKERCDPTKAALLVVDVQNDFCHPEGAFGRAGKDMRAIQDMIPRLAEFCLHARNVEIPIIFVRTTHDETTSSEAWLARKTQTGGEKFPACINHTWGAEFYKIQPQPHDVVITKHRYSAFIGTNLQQVLAAKRRDRLILAGVATNVCVESTARDGLMLDYHIVMAADCTATTDVLAQAASESNVRQNFGWVANMADILKAWDIYSDTKRGTTI